MLHRYLSYYVVMRNQFNHYSFLIVILFQCTSSSGPHSVVLSLVSLVYVHGLGVVTRSLPADFGKMERINFGLQPTFILLKEAPISTSIDSRLSSDNIQLCYQDRAEQQC